MACTYVYKGKKYTEYQILQLIRSGNVQITTSVESARKWLRDTLGMTDDEIEVVKGLIDGDAYGMLENDASILLSDQMTEGTERHEAFHRVFRTMLSPEKRAQLISAFKRRKNWKASLAQIEAAYPELDTDGHIEEYLADEFMYYSLADGNYNVPEEEIRGFFAKLLHFLKSLFTLSVKDLYANIQAGKYKGVQPKYYTAQAKSKVLLPNSTLNTEQKQELFDSLTYRFLDQVFKNHNIYQVIAGKFDNNLHNIFAHLLVNPERTGILNKIGVKDVQLAKDLLNEIFEESPTGKSLQIKKNSVFIKDFFKHLSTLGIKAGIENNNEAAPEFKEGSEEEEDLTKDFSFMKVSFEFDPKANMSKSMRLLLASLGDPKPSPIFKIERAVPYNTVTTLLFNEMSNIPANFDIFMEELERLMVKHPYLKSLHEKLQGNTNNYNTLKFRNEFIRTFGKNRYRFLISMLRKDNIYSTNALFNELENKTVQEFKNNMIITNRSSEAIIQNLKSNDIDVIAKTLGLEDFEDLYNLQLEDGKTVAQKILELKSVVVDSLNAGTPIQKLYDKHANYKLNVKALVKALAGILNENRKPLDLMFYNAEGKKIYAVSLNSYQTIVANTLNWIGRKELSMDEKLELVKQHIPHILNNETYDFENNRFKSAWLASILNGNELSINVMDGLKGQKEKSFKDLNETDLYALYLNSAYQGITIGVKHSDRSTIFSYNLANNAKPINAIRYNDILEIASEIALSYYNDEVNMDSEPSVVKNYFKNKHKPQHFGFVRNKDNAKAEIKEFFEARIAAAILSAEREGVFTSYNGKPVGISAEAWAEFSANGAIKGNDVIKNFVAHTYLNIFFNRIEEQKLFLGHLGMYKNLDDAYKRFAMQSGTGDILVSDQYNNDYISRVNQRDRVRLFNPITNSYEDVIYNKPIGYFSELILEESEEYRSALTDPHPTKEGVSKLHDIFKQGIKRDLITNLKLNEEDADKIAEKQAANYTAKYKALNENDGMSYTNIFGWREFEHRNGIWTVNKENTFQLELAVMGLDNKNQLKDLIIYTNGTTVLARPYGDFKAVKPFDVTDVEQQLNVPNGADWFNSTFESGNMLKPQYTGPVYQDVNEDQKDFIIGGRKTAYGVLFPSMILGTNLQKLNAAMIQKGVDFVHFASAAKYGYFDPKLIMKDVNPESDTVKRGLQFYKEGGEFNDDILNEADALKTYLDVRYMKNQLSISNKPKSEIKNSTQSAKIIIGNIMQNGIPRDVINETLFLNATEEAKRQQSPLYKIMKEYEETLNHLIKSNMNKLLNELQAAKKSNSDNYAIQKFESLIRILKESAESKNSSATILEALDLFNKDKTIELLSNKSKIENILFSIISNNVIRFERPGDAKPQFAVTGLESGTRAFNSSDLKFYEPVYDDAGNIVKVNPAEIALPLPKKHIKAFLKLFNTNNIIEAIEAYNNLPDDKKAVAKGLRIPNQQMSSNDIFRIKRYYLPTFESFVVVPSEIVAKAGADFDIDKLQIYYPTNNADYNKLLDIEKELLLHPDNFHTLLTPVIDDLLKQDILAEVVGKLEKGLNTEDATAKAKSEELVSKSELYDYTDVVRNIEKFKLYIETKTGVGQIATVITTHGVAQVDNITLSDTTYFPDDKGEYTIPASTSLPFEGYQNQYSLSLRMDNTGQSVFETLSMLLTSQVDGAKNPYPSRLNITNQTLNVITFLVRRGVPPMLVIKFMKQPLIIKYLQAQRVNESELFQNTKGNQKLKKSKDGLLEEILGEENVSVYKSYMSYAFNGEAVMTEEELEKGIIERNTDSPNQIKALANFLYLIDITRNFRKFMSDMTPDTKPMKDMAMLENSMENAEDLVKNKIVGELTYRKGMLKPFFDARDNYFKLYVDLYFTKKSKHADDLTKFYNLLTSIQYKTDDKIKVINEIQNDFITYLVQNIHPDFKKYSFNSMMKGPNSLPKRINAMLKDPSNPNYDNYALRNLFMFFNQEGGIDNMRIYDRNMPILAIDDMYDAIMDLPEDLQKELVIYNMYQSGNAVGPFQLDVILPPKIKFDMIKEVLSQNPIIDFTDFIMNFFLNNPKWLPSSKGQAKYNGFPYYTRYEDGKINILSVVDDEVIEPLGNMFSKFYNWYSSSIDTITGSIVNSADDASKASGETVDSSLSAGDNQFSTLMVNSQNNIELYNQLGNRTKSKNVIITSWEELKKATKAITAEGIVSTRIPNTEQHFGNPFSHEPTGKAQGLIKTETIREAVENYINWITTDKYDFDHPLKSMENQEFNRFYEQIKKMSGSNNKNIQEQYALNLLSNLLNRKKWITEHIKSKKLLNKPILYYKELGEPSHATALDYLINKYNWDSENNKTSENTIGEGIEELSSANTPDISTMSTIDAYNMYASKLKAQGINSIMDWLDATEEEQNILLKNCIQ